MVGFEGFSSSSSVRFLSCELWMNVWSWSSLLFLMYDSVSHLTTESRRCSSYLFLELVVAHDEELIRLLQPAAVPGGCWVNTRLIHGPRWRVMFGLAMLHSRAMACSLLCKSAASVNTIRERCDSILVTLGMRSLCPAKHRACQRRVLFARTPFWTITAQWSSCTPAIINSVVLKG